MDVSNLFNSSNSNSPVQFVPPSPATVLASSDFARSKGPEADLATAVKRLVQKSPVPFVSFGSAPNVVDLPLSFTLPRDFAFSERLTPSQRLIQELNVHVLKIQHYGRLLDKRHLDANEYFTILAESIRELKIASRASTNLSQEQCKAAGYSYESFAVSLSLKVFEFLPRLYSELNNHLDKLEAADISEARLKRVSISFRDSGAMDNFFDCYEFIVAEIGRTSVSERKIIALNTRIYNLCS